MANRKNRRTRQRRFSFSKKAIKQRQDIQKPAVMYVENGVLKVEPLTPVQYLALKAEYERRRATNAAG